MHEDITASLFPSPKRREWRRGQLHYNSCAPCTYLWVFKCSYNIFIIKEMRAALDFMPKNFFNPRRKKKAHNQHTDPIVRIKCAFSGRAGCPVNCAEARSRGSPKRRKRCLKDQTKSSEMTIIPSCGDESNCH